jgi:hypothetical protein
MMDYAYQMPSGVMDSMIVETTLMRLDVVSVFLLVLFLLLVACSYWKNKCKCWQKFEQKTLYKQITSD